MIPCRRCASINFGYRGIIFTNDLILPFSICCESFGSVETRRCWMLKRFRVQGHMFLQTDIGFSSSILPSKIFPFRCIFVGAVFRTTFGLRDMPYTNEMGSFLHLSFSNWCLRITYCWKPQPCFISPKALFLNA